MKKITALVFLFWMTHAFSNASSGELQARLNAIQTMKASFQQVIQAKKRKISSSSGTMALSRPGRFRWKTDAPMSQLVVADGKQLWVYDVDLEQVTVKKQEKSVGGTAALFLSGYDDTVARDFEVNQKKKGKQDQFDLQAKSNKASFQRVKLSFVGDQLIRIELFDQLGQYTDVHLSKIQINPTLSNRLFQFKIPKGVDVIRQ